VQLDSNVNDHRTSTNLNPNEQTFVSNECILVPFDNSVDPSTNTQASSNVPVENQIQTLPSPNISDQMTELNKF
jgi:hypothetical protein